MTTKLDDRQGVYLAMANSNTSGALVGTAVNASLAGRCRFVFIFGSNAGGASINANSIGVYKGSTSGAITTVVTSASLAAVSSGALSNVVCVIDAVVDAANPWMEVSGAVVNSSIYASAVAELYNGTELLAPTTGAQQVVTV